MWLVVLSSLVMKNVVAVDGNVCRFSAPAHLQSFSLLQVSIAFRYSNKTYGNHSLSRNVGHRQLYATIEDFYAASSEQEFGASALKEDYTDTLLKLVHITKTGGSALEHWGIKRGIRWGWTWDEIKDPKYGSPLLGPEPWHTPPQFFQQSPYDGYEMFTVVRDPYARMISEFRCPWNGYRIWDLPARAAATVADLNDWILNKLNNESVARPPFIHGHMLPQHLYIFGKNGERLIPEENVLRFENLGEDFASLMQRHNIAFDSLEHNNDSEMKHFNVEDLSQDAARRIEEEYREDFERLGYAKYLNQ
jgi:hypothetical protein